MVKKIENRILGVFSTFQTPQLIQIKLEGIFSWNLDNFQKSMNLGHIQVIAIAK